MQFSSDLPCGVRAVREYIASGQSLRMNVSAEANRAFCLALKNQRKRTAGKTLRTPCSAIFTGGLPE